MIIQGDSLDRLKELEDHSIDSIITDPPYGYSFMGKDWDKAVPTVDIWRECLRVLKPGGWCMVMSAPRSDVQNAMISRLMEAGFRLDFTPIYWTYASGFPKAGNVGKLVDKRNGRAVDPAVKDYLNERRMANGLSLNAVNLALGTATNGGGVASALMGDKMFNELPTLAVYRQLKTLLDLDDRFDELIEREEAEREVIGERRQRANSDHSTVKLNVSVSDVERITISATPQAKALDGSYTGFQPKPAVEVVIVAMKPLSEKTYVDQALKNRKGITWLDDCRVPTEANLNGGGYSNNRELSTNEVYGEYKRIKDDFVQPQGRFPANLLVSDDVLNDGTVTKSTSGFKKNNPPTKDVYGIYAATPGVRGGIDDSGSYSRYFDLDKWAAAHLTEQQMSTFPFAIFPKASKSEKSKGLDSFEVKQSAGGGGGIGDYKDDVNSASGKYGSEKAPSKNHHPTVKPLKLMSYLITLTTREGDTVLDPFVGSGTTVVAAKQLGRKGIGIEREMEYAEIAAARVDAVEIPTVLGATEPEPEEIIEKSEPVPTKPVQARLF